MMDTCRDPEATVEEKERAMSTILEALFPELAAARRRTAPQYPSSPLRRLDDRCRVELKMVRNRFAEIACGDDLEDGTPIEGRRFIDNG